MKSPHVGTAPVALRNAADSALLEILARSSSAGETCEQAFRRKESAVLEYCATLLPIEALALQRRLENPASGDAVARAFGGLVRERRNRIINFLAGARRRAALAAAGR